MSQTSYPTEMANGLAGDLADAGPRDVFTGRNAEASATIPFGVVVGRGTSADDVKLLTSALEIHGVSVRTTALDNIGLGAVAGVDVAAKKMVRVLRKGRVLVAVEVSVAVGDKAYARFTTGILDSGLTQKGSLRNTNDGTAQVSTLTPTAVNTTVYTVAVLFEGFEGSPAQLFSYQTTSDGSATATEICDAFRVLFAADAVFTALCVVTGTTTMILTAQQKGRKFDVTSAGAGAMAIVTTTASATSAKWLRGARFLTAASALGLAVLDFDLNAAID